jgi:predicted Zn-dependent protease
MDSAFAPTITWMVCLFSLTTPDAPRRLQARRSPRRVAHGQTQTGDTGINRFQVVSTADCGDVAGRQLGQTFFGVAVGFTVTTSSLCLHDPAFSG